jgi:hypothetical protein
MWEWEFPMLLSRRFPQAIDEEGESGRQDGVRTGIMRRGKGTPMIAARASPSCLSDGDEAVQCVAADDTCRFANEHSDGFDLADKAEMVDMVRGTVDLCDQRAAPYAAVELDRRPMTACGKDGSYYSGTC